MTQTQVENKWYNYVCSKYPLLTWKVNYCDTEGIVLTFVCNNLNLHGGWFKFNITYDILFLKPDGTDRLLPQYDHFVRGEIRSRVKTVKKLCLEGLKTRVKR